MTTQRSAFKFLLIPSIVSFLAGAASGLVSAMTISGTAEWLSNNSDIVAVIGLVVALAGVVISFFSLHSHYAGKDGHHIHMPKA